MELVHFDSLADDLLVQVFGFLPGMLFFRFYWMHFVLGPDNKLF
jgi:hypothetical protein